MIFDKIHVGILAEVKTLDVFLLILNAEFLSTLKTKLHTQNIWRRDHCKASLPSAVHTYTSFPTLKRFHTVV